MVQGGGHRGTRAVQRMVEFAPSTGGLALWVGHLDDDDDDDDDGAGLVHTDGDTVFYGSAFAALPVAQQAGWVAHEVLHIALRHAQRFVTLQALLGDADPRLFNICADAIVNSALSHLGWLALPPSAVMLERLLSGALGIEQGVETALLEWDVERLYRAIDDRRPPAQDGRRNDGPRATRARALGAGMQADLKPRHGAGTSPQDEADAGHAWNERLLRAHAGDAAFSMLRTLLADLPATRTPWQQVLRVRLARGLSSAPALQWSRPARSYIARQGRSGPHRLPWEPGFGGARPVPRLAVVVDVSGSIDDALMERFAREIDAITRRLQAALLLVVGDDQVRQVLHCAPGRSGLREIRFQGGGGTDFTPLLQEADQHRPDMAVVLTDLDGPARFKPHWPVLWAVPRAHAGAVAPFGRKLVLE